MCVFKKFVHIPRDGETLADWLRGLFDVGELPKDALWMDAALGPDERSRECVITYLSRG